MELSVVILAAGKGTRMRSSMPKVLHPVASKPMVQHVIDTSNLLNAKHMVVVAGHGIEQVKQQLAEQPIEIAEQLEQLGTAHAVQQATPLLNPETTALILYGDVPLISEKTLKELLKSVPDSGIGLLTVALEDSTGYGRIIRNENDQVVAIVEQKDANEAQLAIKEVNTGILAAKTSDLTRWLAAVDNNNAQQEYYLTDIIAMAANEGGVIASHPQSSIEVEGVNSRIQLAQLERAYQKQLAEELMDGGVTVIDPSRLDIRGSVNCAQDATIDVNVVLEGEVTIGTGTSIGANSIIINSTIGNNCTIKPNSIIENSIIENHCQVGPFARLRPGTHLADNAFIGNFVETKKANFGLNSKASHLSYIGDAEIGANVNIGAGVITCNYDGVNKFKTIIEDGAFIGSDSQLVAPVTVGAGATVAAGTTVTKNVESQVLVLSRTKQKQVEGWKRPEKKK